MAQWRPACSIGRTWRCGLIYLVENIGGAGLPFAAVEYLDGSNAHTPIADGVRLKGS
jgi:hypothetical protein